MAELVSQHTDAIGWHELLGRSLTIRHEPGAAELCEGLQGMLGNVAGLDGTVRLEFLKKAVYRLRLGTEPGRSFILKRHRPAIAHTDRLLQSRWLPALGLLDCSPRLLAAAAQREGRWIWHVYDDLGGETLTRRPEPRCEDAAIDLIVDLHTRAVGQPLLAEVRWYGRDHGAHFFTSSLRDGIALLETLATYRADAPDQFAAVRMRLLERLYAFLDDAPRRVRILEDVGGRDTLLHGDLWPDNVFVALTSDGVCARLIDWDHISVGPFGFDVSTLLYRTPAEARPSIWRRYRERIERAGWRLADDAELNILFHTSEVARSASCIVWPALALLNERAAWGVPMLLEIDRWFDVLRPPLPGEAATP